MDIKTIFAVLAFVLSAFAYIPYVQGVLKSETRPTVSTWISWGLMDAAALAGMIAAGEMAWQMVAYVVGVAFVLAASFYKHAALGWKRLDSLCIGIVSLAIIGWLASGDPNVAIVLSLVAAVVGSIPMAVNSAQDPHNEPLLPWVFVLAGGICGVLAINSWTVAGAGTPVVFAGVQAIFVILISRKFIVRKAAV